jgi:hypothetical protein
VTPEPTFLIPDRASDWAARLEAACAVLDAAFDTRLGISMPYQADKPQAPVADRVVFFRAKAKNAARWFSLHNGEPYLPPACDEGTSRFCSIGGRRYSNPGVYNVMAFFPSHAPAAIEPVLVALGDALAAHSTQYSPRLTAQRLLTVYWRTALEQTGRELLPELSDDERTLPKLRNSLYDGLASPFQPLSLGWLNYWSEETARYLGFPDPALDAELLRQSYRTPAGAWLVKFGEEPLDATKPAHVRRLAEAYGRFPAAGVRTP